jgi:hypothetical protein
VSTDTFVSGGAIADFTRLYADGIYSGRSRALVPPHGHIAATNTPSIRLALAMFVYGVFVGTVFITGIAVFTFLFNMGGRGWDYLRSRRMKR